MKELRAVKFDGRQAIIHVTDPVTRKKRSYTRYVVGGMVNNTDEALRENDLAGLAARQATRNVVDLEDRLKIVEERMAQGPTGDELAELKAKMVKTKENLSFARESAKLADAHLKTVQEESPRVVPLVLYKRDVTVEELEADADEAQDKANS